MDSQLEFQYLANTNRMAHAELIRLMEQYGDDVRKYAYAITKSREQAKDVAQEAFIKAYRGIESFRGHSSMKTWLFAITRNIAINEMKSSYIRRIVLFQRVKPPNAGQSAESAYFEDQSAREVRELMMGLPMKLREVLVLTLEHEMTMIEIANMLRVSEGTIKSRLHRARKAMDDKWREKER
ncbi:RNA polymerase sigma factor [Cohnella suwonensis]|uniref:RNA polymerase sigma factor n=1 Tax=Cohnella suwonensis TaxID=696072 RepID=A0ABW0M2J8_9BACL